MNGRVVGCLQVGVLGPGPYHVVLDQAVLGGGEGGGVTGTETTVQPQGAVGVGTGPAVALSVSPARGAPGTRVTVTGRVASPIPAASNYLAGGAHANLCWDGCRGGLQYQGVELSWTSPTSFRATLVVPAAPWVERLSHRVVRPVSGTYPVGIQCIGSSSGCALHGSEGSADFRLEVPKSAGTRWCRAMSSCAHLSVTPGRALPGEVIRVEGYAPLESVIGSDQPFTFELQVIRGPPHGPEVEFKELANVDAVNLFLGDGALELEAPPAWRNLPTIVPIAEVDAGLPSISADPADRSTVAWCGNGTVTISGAGGQVQVPTGSAAEVLESMASVPFGNGGGPAGASAPSCVTAIPLGTEPDSASGESSPVVVAAFVVAPGGVAPPTADVALFTTNDGQTWAAIPVPPGADSTAFGGFRVQGDDLDALFTAATSGAEPPPPLVESSSDGGRTWHATDLPCPTEGPCVTLGPATSPDNCAMTGTLQAVLRSSDGGRSWTQVGWPSTVNACSEAEVVATSPRADILVSSASPYVLTRSTDGGATWSDIGLPALPGEDVDAGLGLGFGGVTVLSDGALLAAGGPGDSSRWELLRPGATSWCAVRGISTAEQHSVAVAPIELIGTQIWWLSEPDPLAGPIAHHLTAANLSC